MSKQQGFTLIELVMVIVILGILAATAIPRFVDISAQARQSVVDGIAGSLASGSSMNYGASLARGQIDGALFGTVDTTPQGTINTTGGCADAVGTLFVQGVTFGAGAGNYSITGGAAGLTNIGNTINCTVTSNDDALATNTFQLIATQ